MSKIKELGEQTGIEQVITIEDENQYTPIDETPFARVKNKGKEHIVIGNQALASYENEIPDSIIEKLKALPWEIILPATAVFSEKMTEAQKTIKNKKK